ncbi:MAG: hypothetical protein MI725_11940 [Pirellulales bacterium]|nr:hypothetical protein [Pirellulales bacterium]
MPGIRTDLFIASILMPGVLSTLLLFNLPQSHATTIDISSGNVTLDQLVGNDFIEGDKKFEITGFSGTGVHASSIVVTPVNQGLAGIGFDLVPVNGSTFIKHVEDDDDNDGVGVSASFTLNYKVTVLDPLLRITDAHLVFDGMAVAHGEEDDDDNGSAFANVTETYTGVGLNETLAVMVNTDMPDDMDASFFAAMPQTMLTVEKVVDLFATGGDDDDGDDDDSAAAEINFIRQTFSQGLIPEPATGTLLLIAMFGLATVRRR